jgi:phosphonate transport system permease protein
MTTTSRRRDLAPPPRRRPSPLAWTVIVMLAGAHVLAWRGTDFSLSALADGWHGMARFLGGAIPPRLDWDTVLRPSLKATAVTLYIALLGTTLSAPFALALAVMGSRATTRGPMMYQLARSILSFLRSVPDVVFALIFVTAVGLGPFAGVLALIFHNTGVMGKLWAEAMEESDPGVREALRVLGASRIQIAVHAVLPTVLPQLVGLLLYRFDVNVRASLVLGLVGAGGIGFLINQSINLFRFDEMLTQIVIILILIVAVDQLSAHVRRRITA